MIELFFKLLCGHALADYCLQTEFIAKNKNRHNKAPAGYDPNLHGPMQMVWPWVLTAHALTHGFFVYVFTGGCWQLGIAETVAHWLIDFGKCEKWYGIHQDQMLHIMCKFMWITIMASP